MKKFCLLLFLVTLPLFAQTTTFTQTGGSTCHVTGCSNAPVSDGETFSFSDTLKYYGSYSIAGTLTFRGIGYALSGTSSGYQTIDLSANDAGPFAVHEDFAIHCFRGCGQTWLDGSLTVPNEYLGIQVDKSQFLYVDVFGHVVQQYPNWPSTAFGGSVYCSAALITPCNGEGPLNGTVQVGLAAPASTDTTVLLSSSDPTFTVPVSVTIPAGSLYANFYGQLAAVVPYPQADVSAIITATFPDGTTSSVTVVDGTGPAPAPQGGGDD